MRNCNRFIAECFHFCKVCGFPEGRIYAEKIGGEFGNAIAGPAVGGGNLSGGFGGFSRFGIDGESEQKC